MVFWERSGEFFHISLNRPIVSEERDFRIKFFVFLVGSLAVRICPTPSLWRRFLLSFSHE